MIEGLRLLPWFQEAARRGLLGDMARCSTCLASTPEATRQQLGCGYAPLPSDGVLRYRQIPTYSSNVDPTVCPGYSTSLPEVIEVARARLHWSKGSLGQFVRGQASEATMQGIEILEGACNACQSWVMDNPQKKGG